MRPKIYFNEEPCERAKEILLDYFTKISIGSYPVDVVWTGLKRVWPARGIVVATPCTGTNHVTADTIIHLDQEFKSTVGNFVTSTAEHTLSLMLQLAKKARMQLHGKVLGIIGYGRIGRMVADYANTLGMKILIYDINGTGNATLDELLKLSDVISLHIPLEGNKDFLQERHLNEIKNDVLLVNTSRQDVINFDALDTVIKMQDIYYADDFEKQYNWSDYQTDRVIQTPHIAGNSKEAREITDIWLAKKLIRYWRSRTHENNS